MASLALTDGGLRTVWRVGFAPAPLEWPGWQYAENGRFPGRWDDSKGEFRTTYLGDSLYACLLEVLAFAQEDTTLADELADIEEDPEDAETYPTATPGQLTRNWLAPRRAARASLYGHYCIITASDSIAALRPAFITAALDAGYADFDAALLKDGSTPARRITQAVSSYLYNQPHVGGIRFLSRHGDDLPLWCMYEQPHDGHMSKHLSCLETFALTNTTPELLQAFETFDLKWASSESG